MESFENDDEENEYEYEYDNEYINEKEKDEELIEKKFENAIKSENCENELLSLIDLSFISNFCEIWKFRIYEELCLYTFKNKNFSQFEKYFDIIIELYGNIDYYKKDELFTKILNIFFSFEGKYSTLTYIIIIIFKILQKYKETDKIIEIVNIITKKYLMIILDRVLYFIPFYSLGILYKKYEKYDRLPSVVYFSIIMGIVIFFIFLKDGIPGFTISWCNDFTSNPLSPFVVGFLGIAFWLRIAKILEPVVGRNKYINIIADNTYSIMINQFLGFMIVKTLFAFISKYSGYFNNFDMYKYKTDIWYYYIPHNLSQLLILYLIAGIIFPIIVQLTINKLKK